MAPAGNTDPAEPGQVAMAATALFFLILQSLIQYPQMAGDGLDEDTRLRMELRAERLNREMTRLLQELEQGPLECTVSAWGALPWAALQHGHLWAPAGVLVLLLGLWFSHRRSHEGDNNGEEEEDRECNNDAFEEEEDGEVIDDADEEEEEEEEEETRINSVIQIKLRLIRWPFQDVKRGCEMTNVLMEDFVFLFKHSLSNTFYPLPQRAIGVGSAFEGWSPLEEVIAYRVLVPLNPPPGHTFRLELVTAGHIPGRNFRIRVEQVCTCTREKQGENGQCFLHYSEEEQRGNEDPSHIHTLCTGSYLDVEKTARWLGHLVSKCWEALPQARDWYLVVQPHSRSCKLKLRNFRESFTVEMLFGVQQGDSDIFVSSQYAEARYTPSKMWPETYSVAEVKFFRHINSQAPRDSWHLKYLQLFDHALLGTGFSTYTLKTIVMHLLNTVPVSQWGSRQFLQRLEDTMQYLHCCVSAKRLNHFIVGNQRLPEVISLPPDVQTAEPPNLFHHLARDPAAYNRAVSDCRELLNNIERILLYGR